MENANANFLRDSPKKNEHTMKGKFSFSCQKHAFIINSLLPFPPPTPQHLPSSNKQSGTENFL